MTAMRIPFTKMQGTGNDFVVIDETQVLYHLSAQQYRAIADRHFGVGADQILSVRSTALEGLDFEYVIHNADGSEVEHCGNGARCFLRFVRESGLSQKSPLRVKVKKGIIELVEHEDHQVTVQMGAPNFEPQRIPFLPERAVVDSQRDGFTTWRLARTTRRSTSCSPATADTRRQRRPRASPTGSPTPRW